MPDLLERLTTALADRYAVESEIGRGGMATVYLAEDLKHHRQVAIKVLHPELAVAVGTDRFLREIEILAGLQHPHILPLYDSGEADELLYFVMPFVEGENLRDRLEREQRLPEDQALRLVGEIADALAYAHRHGLIHRDIKPANILLSEGHAFLADFGIARAVAEAGEGRFTATGMSIGSPRYMSPEQATADRQIDARTDIYSLGCVLHEMLTGKPPFHDLAPLESLRRRAVEQPPGPRAMRPDLPEALDTVVMRAMAPIPEDRYATVSEFVDALQEIQDGSTREPYSRRNAVWIVVGTSIVMLAAMYLLSSKADVDAGLRAVAAVTEIRNLVGDARYAEAYRRAGEVASEIDDDSLREEIWSAASVSGTINSDPVGAAVWARPYNSTDVAWDSLGLTPLEAVRLPLGVTRLRFVLEGFSTRNVAVRTSRARAFPEVEFKLDKLDSVPDGMVRVDGGEFTVWLPGLEQLQIELPYYFIDAYEVTNRQFKEFVDAGGYTVRQYWTEPFLRDGRPLAWETAIAEFTDRTGRSGPSTWEVGSYPSGQADLPVGGISWYEAAAFASWSGKELPTVYHWYWAASPYWGDFILSRSNFSGEAVAPAGAYDGMSRWGVYDVAGNTREWCYNSTDQKRFVLGGGWDDPAYMFTDANAQSPFDRSPTNGLRLVTVPDTENFTLARQPIERPARDYFSEEPVSDEIFDVYRRAYVYDAAALDTTRESSDVTKLWIREEISINAAYGGERMTVLVYLPRKADPPYQPIIYFPGSNVISSLSNAGVDNYAHTFDFIVRSGRALVYPIYKGTFARSTELDSDIQDESTLWREHVVAWAKDVGRTIDYLESRDDIDTENIGYFGFSWGSAVAPVMLAVEDRLKAGVLLSGGLLMHPTQPEVDPFNFLPRVRVPTLMVNVPNDYFYPLEKSQMPMFHFLGTPGTVKDSVLIEGGHLPPINVVARHTLDWFDRYLGPAE